MNYNKKIVTLPIKRIEINTNNSNLNYKAIIMTQNLDDIIDPDMDEIFLLDAFGVAIGLLKRIIRKVENDQLKYYAEVAIIVSNKKYERILSNNYSISVTVEYSNFIIIRQNIKMYLMDNACISRVLFCDDNSNLDVNDIIQRELEKSKTSTTATFTSDNINKNPDKYDNISWDSYFMGIAQLSSLRSKDPVTKVGSVIVAQDNRILSIGYNGFPNNCPDEKFPWDAEAEDILDTKDYYVVHSELNAILNYKGSRTNLENSKIYVTLFPCCECAKAIIQCGIKEVIFKTDKDSVKTKAAKRMFDSAGVIYRKYESVGKKETIEF